MSGLMIIAHAPLASSLKAVAEHAYPDCSRLLEALDVPAGMPLEEVQARAREMLARVRDPEALVFTDVFGATPCNVAQSLGEGATVQVIAGVNVPMLWRALCYAAEPIEGVVRRAMAGATQGVMLVVASKPQNQTVASGAHDQNQRHDQQ